MDAAEDLRRPLLGIAKEDDESLSQRPSSRPQPASHDTGTASLSSNGEEEEMDLQNMSRRTQWIILAVASGACAAFNGVFAKL